MRKLNMPRRLSSSAARTHGGNMLFMLPTIILFCIVVLIPFFQGIPYSFTNWKSIVSETKEFNGLKNYIYLIKNKYFQDSLLVTFKFTILYMISANVMGLLLALAIHRSSWFNNIARTVLFLPFTVSVTAGSIVWSYVFTDVYGTLTGLVSPLGMPGQIIYGMVVIGAWRDMGYTMLIYIAALQAVPQDYYEAATVDGARKAASVLLRDRSQHCARVYDERDAAAGMGPADLRYAHGRCPQRQEKVSSPRFMSMTASSPTTRPALVRQPLLS